MAPHGRPSVGHGQCFGHGLNPAAIQCRARGRQIRIGSQHALKKAFLASYQGRAEAIELHDVMLAAVLEAGLDVAQARAILESDTYAQDVKDTEQYYTQAGIRSVPAIIINQKHLISGGQPTEVFEQALRQIAQQEATV